MFAKVESQERPWNDYIKPQIPVAQAQGLSRKSVTQQTENDNNGRKVLAGSKINSKMI